MEASSRSNSTTPLPGVKPTLRALSFSGCGGMFPYVLGVAHAISEDFDLTSTKFYGASGGTAAAAMLAAEHNIVDFFENCGLAGLIECGTRWHGTQGNGLEIAAKHLHAYLPDDIYLKVNGRATFVTTTLFPRPGIARYSFFEDTHDMARCMRASSHIPGVLSFYPWSWYRGTLCIDGGIILNQPTSLEAPYTVKIYPSKYRRTMPWWVLPCTDAAWNRQLFWQGYADGKANAKNIELEGKGALTDVGWCQYGVPLMIMGTVFRFFFRVILRFLMLFSHIRKEGKK